MSVDCRVVPSALLGLFVLAPSEDVDQLVDGDVPAPAVTLQDLLYPGQHALGERRHVAFLARVAAVITRLSTGFAQPEVGKNHIMSAEKSQKETEKKNTG